jgi:hypothetical protein
MPVCVCGGGGFGAHSTCVCVCGGGGVEHIAHACVRLQLMVYSCMDSFHVCGSAAGGCHPHDVLYALLVDSCLFHATSCADMCAYLRQRF